MTDQPEQLKDAVLKAIESGQVKMRPKWQFVLRTVVLVLGIVLVALTTLFLASFIVFALRQTGVLFVPGFGREGFGAFFGSLPWVLLAVAVVFMILLEVLIRKYSFAYGRPLTYSAVGVVVIVLAGGVAIGYTSFHQNLFDRAERGNLPIGGPMYEHFMQPQDNVTVGVITGLTNPGYKIRDRRGKIFTVKVTSQTKLPPGNDFTIGDNVVVLGSRHGDSIDAIGIEKPGPGLPPPPDDEHLSPPGQPPVNE